MMVGGMMGAGMGRRRRFGWGGPVGGGGGCGLGMLLPIIIGLMLIFGLLSMCSPRTTVQSVGPIPAQPGMGNSVVLDANAENNFDSRNHVGRDVVNVPFDDYFEENAVYMIPNRNTNVEVCSWDASVSAEIVTIMRNNLNYPNVTNSGVCGR